MCKIKFILKKCYKNIHKSIDKQKNLCYNIKVENIGVSPSGKASDSDSDITGVRIPAPQPKNPTSFDLSDFFIHCESNGISSRFSVYLITEGAYHQPQAVFAFAMMIYNGKPLVIYNASP